MRKLVASTIAALAAAAAQAQAPSPVPPMPIPVERPPAPAPGAIEMNVTQRPGKATASRLATAQATIVDLDRAARTVTVQRQSGETRTLKAGPDVVRFDELAVGDVIQVQYRQDLELEAQTPGSPDVPMSSGANAVRNDRDKAPGAEASAGVQGTVIVTAIDRATRLVSFKEPGGATFEVTAGPTVHLEKLQVGDRLLATYVENVAVNVVKIPGARR
ncbi:MAG: hypothetical protein WB493_09085 [Anaeromyxobacteraceae bacterium]